MIAVLFRFTATAVRQRALDQTIPDVRSKFSDWPRAELQDLTHNRRCRPQADHQAKARAGLRETMIGATVYRSLGIPPLEELPPGFFAARARSARRVPYAWSRRARTLRPRQLLGGDVAGDAVSRG